MRTRLLWVLSSALLFRGWTNAQLIQPQVSASGLQASNILNPNVSVIGWFQGETGNRQVRTGAQPPPSIQLKEAELALQSVVDPYAKADFFVAVDGEGKVDLEEGTLTWFSLPYELSLKAGKFKGGFGKFNRTHRPETAFADRPLVHEAYFGEEGLSSVGGSLSWHVPNPWLLISLDGEALTMPEAAEAPAFDKAERRDLLYLGRLGTYYDLTESVNIAFGGSFAYGAAGQAFDPVALASSTLRSRIHGLDLSLRWKNPRRAIYRSLLWQSEVLWNTRELTQANAANTWGLFTHLEYQFARRWRAGARCDWSQPPGDSSRHESGGLAYLTFSPSEFSLISLQGRRVNKADGAKENLGFLKLTFNIGPHGAHPL